MGCTGSKDNHLRELEELKEYLRQYELKTHEQQNLLRFKIEVLVNMLTAEEKRNELTSKRLDTLKWLIHSQGVSEETITKILASYEKNGKLDLGENALSLSMAQFPSSSNALANSTTSLNGGGIGIPQLIDLSGAIDRMRDEFTKFRLDILHAYALDNGKIISTLPTKDFIEQTYNVTENISKTDLKVLALRFDNGFNSVLIPEFIEFFSTPPEIRNARIATNAVKMSLDLLSLDAEILDGGMLEQDREEDELGMKNLTEREREIKKQIEDKLLYDEELGPEIRKSHFTSLLERGAKRLLIMWIYVRDELETTFVLYHKASIAGEEKNVLNNTIEQIIDVGSFERAMVEVCGKNSIILENAMKEGLISLRGGPIKPASATTATANDKENTSPNNNNKKEKAPPTPKPLTRKGSSNNSNSNNPNNPANANANAQIPNVNSKIPQIDPLDEEDILFLIDRFELTGFIHYRHFMDFFDKTYQRWLQFTRKYSPLKPELFAPATANSKNVETGISPFLLLSSNHSDWKALRESSVLRASLRDSQEIGMKKIMKNVDNLKKPEPRVFTAPKKLPASPPPAAPPAEPKPEPKPEPPAAPVEAKPAPAPTPTSPPVVEKSGCFLCSGSKKPPVAENKPLPAPPAADEKKLDDSDAKAEGKESESKTNDSKDLAIDTKLDDDSSLSLKHDDSFETPKHITRKPIPRFENNNSGGMLDRDGLGHGDDREKRAVKAGAAAGGGGGSRFRRRAEKDFDQEKTEVEDNSEIDILARK